MINEKNGSALNNNIVKKINFLNLALISFLVLGMELLIIAVETTIYGISINEYTYTMGCMHLVYTIIVWGFLICALINYSRKKCFYDIFKEKSMPSIKRILTVLVILIVMIIWKYIDWSGIKIIKEFEHNGLLKGILQHLYYFCETGLVTLIIVFGQKYGEIKFKNNKKMYNFPYGALLLAVTWGLAHILTKDILCGIESIIFSIFFGVTYLLLRKNTKLSYLFITLMFIL